MVGLGGIVIFGMGELNGVCFGCFLCMIDMFDGDKCLFVMCGLGWGLCDLWNDFGMWCIGVGLVLFLCILCGWFRGKFLWWVLELFFFWMLCILFGFWWDIGWLFDKFLFFLVW